MCVCLRPLLSEEKRCGLRAPPIFHGPHVPSMTIGGYTSQSFRKSAFPPMVSLYLPSCYRARSVFAPSPSPVPKAEQWLQTLSQAPRSLTPLEARGTLFDEGPDAFPGILRFTADVLREGFKFQGSAQLHVLVMVQGTLGQA